MTDLASLIRSSSSTVVADQISKTCPWLLDSSSISAPLDGDKQAESAILAAITSGLCCDRAVEGVVRLGLLETAKTLLSHPHLMCESSAIQIVNRFPSLTPLLAVNVSSFSSTSLSQAVRKHLTGSSLQEVIRKVIDLLESHDILGADAATLAPKAPSVSSLITLTSIIVDGKLVEWLTSGAPAEATALHALIARMTKDATGELKLLASLDGLIKERGSTVTSRVIRI